MFVNKLDDAIKQLEFENTETHHIVGCNWCQATEQYFGKQNPQHISRMTKCKSRKIKRLRC